MQISEETRRLAKSVKDRMRAIPGSDQWTAEQFYAWMDDNVTQEEGVAVFTELLEIEDRLA